MTRSPLTDAEIVDRVRRIGATVELPLFDDAEVPIHSEIDDLDHVRAATVVRRLLEQDVDARMDLARHLLAHFAMMRRAVHDPEALLEDLDGAEPTIENAFDLVRFRSLELAQISGSPWAIPTFDPDKAVYVVLEMSVPWEPEHNIWASWEEGADLVKLGDSAAPLNEHEVRPGHEACVFHSPDYDLCTQRSGGAQA